MEKMADVKSLLKEARKLIDENNYKEAQECCKNILRKDKDNYLGLVLLGKSLQDKDEAPLAFQKAIACKKDHILAWQGLANYYEKRDDCTSKQKLMSIYGEMLTLQLEEDKVADILTKLGQLGCSLKNSLSVDIILDFMNKKHELNINNIAEKVFIKLLTYNVPYTAHDLPLYLSTLNNIYKNNPGDPVLELTIAKTISSAYETSVAIGKITNLPFFLSNKALREWLCYYLFEKYVQEGTFYGYNIEKEINIITQDIEDHKCTNLLKSVIYYEKGNFLEAYKQCIPLINYNQPEQQETTYIIRCTSMLKKWSVTEKLTSVFLTKVNDYKFSNVLKKYLFVSLAKQCKWQQALSIVQNGLDIDQMSTEHQALLAECYIRVKEPVDNILKNLSESQYFVPLQALKLISDKQYEKTVSLLENSTSELAINYYYLGLAQWELKRYDKCHINFLKAAKLDPCHAHTFLYLGHFYKICMSDLDKAKKCYERAFNINQFDDEIARNLSETYAKLGLKDLDYELLNTLENSQFVEKTWVHFRLGLHLLNRRNWEEAIIMFRNVIKSNKNNSTAFECLADAYYARGSYTSALRAYNKIITLNPDKATHCLTRIGYIYTLLMRYNEAVITFEQVLKMNSQSVLTLKGIAETWMKIAQKQLTAKMYGSARDSAQKAVDYITKAVNNETEYTCFMKMLGDAYIFITKLPITYSFVNIKKFRDNESNDTKKIEKLDIFPYAIACYSHVMKCKKQTTSFDLALAYLTFYRESKERVNCQISFNITLSCVKKKPSIWRNWNLLGKLCLLIRKYDLAQHCFIKALLVTRKWSIAKIWCNLGTLYLKLKLFKQANYCYWRGQSTLPSYPQSWIGQALIAEAIREEEAMDLFRHASRLGYHRESALGYADWVCRTLKSNKANDPDFKYVIDSLYAVPYAIDLIQWLCTFENNNACAYTILGVLQERFGLIQPAKQSFEKAIIHVDERNKNIALLNMARILLRVEKYDEAVTTFKAITEATLDSACGLALALFKKGLYEEAYASYDTALHWLSDYDNEKSEVLVAMAGIVYMFKGSDEAKILLFQSIQLSQKKPTPHSLFAVCALGILHSDENLSKLALLELRKYDRNVIYSFDIGFLKSYVFVCEDKMEEAIKSISDSIHDYPDSALLWFCMAQYCLQNSRSRAKAASVCAQRAMISAHSKFNYDNNPAQMLAIASIAEHEAGNRNLALLLAKKGFHMYPQQSEILAALMFSVISNKISTDKKHWLSSAATHIKRHLDISRNLSRWVGIVENKLKTIV